MSIRLLSSFIAAVLLLQLPALVFAAEEKYTYSSISFRGNSRITTKTLINSIKLPKRGTVTNSDVEKIIQNIYSLKYFDDVRVLIDKRTLIIEMKERPSISEVTIDGNKLIDTEVLTENLDDAGVAKGEVFNEGILNVIQREILRAYNNEGRYGATVTSATALVGHGGIDIQIEIEEGEQAYINRINLIGNSTFTTKELLRLFASKTLARNEISGSDHRYSKRKLEGDLEALRSWYLDHGYLQFSILSNNVFISPEKDSIEISINIQEGLRYKVKEIDLVLVNYSASEFNKDDLAKFIFLQKENLFSQKLLTLSTKVINDRLSDYGYAYSKSEYLTDLDEEKKTVDVKLIIDPGNKMIVRRINFINNETTADKVLRREMRQFEGAPFSKTLLDRSKERLQRLVYIAEAKYVFERVSGSSNLVDVIFTVSERQSGSFTFGLGYSPSFNTSLNLSLSRDNFLNSGDSISLQVNYNRVQATFAASYRISYFTDEGVDFTTTFQFLELDTDELTTIPYLLDSAHLSFGWSIPITEYSSFFASFGYEERKLSPLAGLSSAFVNSYINAYGTDYSYLISNLGYAYDTRNRTLFPDQGLLFQSNLLAYSSDRSPSFYKTLINLEYYETLINEVVFAYKLTINNGANYDNIDRDFNQLPPDQREYLGGITNLRAYEPLSLGPKVSPNSNINIGGHYSLSGAIEFYFDPMRKAIGNAPKSENPLRIVAFFDYGYVYPTFSAFSSSQLRYDIGVGLIWVTPVGPLLFSYARPLRRFTEDEQNVEEFQFSVGAGF